MERKNVKFAGKSKFLPLDENFSELMNSFDDWCWKIRIDGFFC